MITCTRPGTALLASGLLLASAVAHAGGKIAIDDTKWISVGAAARTSFTAMEDSAPNGSDWSTDFNADSARIYVNGQIHQYIKFELNTECVFCGNSTLRDFHLLDAIAKFEISPYFNIWAGRLLVPAERQELNGPYYSTTYDAYKTPFYSSDYSVTFGNGSQGIGAGAGVYARDHGVNIWGAAGPGGALQYVFGVFNGLQSAGPSIDANTGKLVGGPNQGDNLMYAGRVAYNFLSVEKNPGYYTSGTYYGGGGDILTLGFAFQTQNNGAGSFLHQGDFFGYSFDLLFEKILPNKGVVTVNGEFKEFDADYSALAFTDTDCFCMFDGKSYSVAALYLIPETVGIGKFQPYVRYSNVIPDNSTSRNEVEGGVNYVIDGHNARVALFYQHGDIATKALNYAPTAIGSKIDAIKLAVQLQL